MIFMDVYNCIRVGLNVDVILFDIMGICFEFLVKEFVNGIFDVGVNIFIVLMKGCVVKEIFVFLNLKLRVV